MGETYGKPLLGTHQEAHITALGGSLQDPDVFSV